MYKASLAAGGDQRSSQGIDVAGLAAHMTGPGGADAGPTGGDDGVVHYGSGVTSDDSSPDIPAPPGGLPPADDHEVVDQDELRPPLPPLDTGTAAPMPDVAPGPESPMPPLDAPGVSPDLPAGPTEPDGDVTT